MTSQRSPRDAPEAAAYLVGLRLLGGRELSRAGLAERLRRRGFEESSIHEALDRLVASGALDDWRAARAFASASIRRGRGRLRVLQDLLRRGIDPDCAHAAVEEAFAEVDEEALIARVLAAHQGGPIRTPLDMRRLHRFLVRRGFSSRQAIDALRRHRGISAVDE